jgi:hypothetical protein
LLEQIIDKLFERKTGSYQQGTYAYSIGLLAAFQGCEHIQKC